MPGSSLWLVPPPSHPLHDILAGLIAEGLPARFAGKTGPAFAPHLTLTSGVAPSAYGAAPQKWLDAVPWPAGRDVRVRFEAVASEDVFFRRCYVKVSFDGVRGVAGLARARGVLGEETIGDATEAWLEEWRRGFGPHVSLIYGDEVIDEGTLAQIKAAVEEAGVNLQGEGLGGGWDGGVVWLVPTDQPIEEWRPIATRVL